MPSPSPIFFYSAYGLVIAADFEFPELVPLVQAPEHIDVRVRRETIAVEPGMIDRTKEYDWFAEEGFFVLHFEEIGTITVSEGNVIVVDPAPDATLDRVRLFVLGTCFGVLLHQKGLLPIHGCAIATEYGCKIFAGPVGIGKSTLATAFLKSGYRVLADDVSTVSIFAGQPPLVYPSYPQIKLCPDSADELSIGIADLAAVDTEKTKFRYPIAAGHHQEPMTLSGVYFLHTHKKDNFAMEPVRGAAKFDQLATHTYRNQLLDAIKVSQHHFKLCAALAGLVPMYSFKRSTDRFEVSGMVEFLESHFRES